MTASNPLSAWMYPKEWASSTAQYFNSDDEEFSTNFVKSCELRDAAIRQQAIEETKVMCADICRKKHDEYEKLKYQEGKKDTMPVSYARFSAAECAIEIMSLNGDNRPTKLPENPQLAIQFALNNTNEAREFLADWEEGDYWPEYLAFIDKTNSALKTNGG